MNSVCVEVIPARISDKKTRCAFVSFHFVAVEGSHKLDKALLILLLMLRYQTFFPFHEP